MKETDLETRGLCFQKKSLQNPFVCPQTCFVVFFNGGLGSCFFLLGGGGSQISRDLCLNRLGKTTTFGSLGIIKPLS